MRENVAVGAMYGAGGAKRSRRGRRSSARRELLEFVHLAPRRERAGRDLPIAGRKRLELAKALAMEPSCCCSTR